MSESDFVTAVNEKTKLVSEIPRDYLERYPDFKELSEDEVTKLRRRSEKEILGEYVTPTTTAKAADQPAEAQKEGSK